MEFTFLSLESLLLSSSKMKVAIFVLALASAILAVPQDKPDIVGERQDEPIAERQDEPVADRMYGK